MKVDRNKSAPLTALITLFLSALAVSVTAADPPNFTGHWVLNTKDSDDLAEAIGGARGARQDSGGGMGRSGGKGGGGRRGGGGGKGGSSGGDEERPVRAQQKPARGQEEYSRLDIFHDGIELNVTNGLDISRLLYTDGRQMTIWTQNGEATATASWQDRTLMVTWKTGQDTMSRIRYYTLAEDRQQLTMAESHRLPDQEKTVEIKMVYDLQEK